MCYPEKISRSKQADDCCGIHFGWKKRSSKHRGHAFNMMVWLHSNCQKNLFCHHLWLQRTSLQDELKYWISAKSEESTVIQSKGMRIARLKPFRTQKISLTGMGTWIIQMTAKTIAWRTLNLAWSKTIASTIRNAQSRGMWVPRHMFLDWFSRHGCQRDRLKAVDNGQCNRNKE